MDRCQASWVEKGCKEIVPGLEKDDVIFFKEHQPTFQNQILTPLRMGLTMGLSVIQGPSPYTIQHPSSHPSAAG